MRLLSLVLSLLLTVFPAFAQSPGTVNLQGPSTTPGAPIITSVTQLNDPINTALAAKADATGGVLTNPTLSGTVSVGSGADITALHPAFTATVAGSVPAPVTVSGNCLKDDGTWGSCGSGGGPAGSSDGALQYKSGTSFGALVLGTTTTVLHGNASGAPTFGAVNLAADVTGSLPMGNLAGGVNASSTTYLRGDGTWVTPAGAGTITGVTAGTGLTGGGSSGGITVNLANTLPSGLTIPSAAHTGTSTFAGIANTGALTTTTFQGMTPAFLTAWNAYTNGVAAGGSGHAIGDIVTMSDGTKIGVQTVSSGAVTLWYVSKQAAVATVPSQPVTQSSTTGSGTGLQLTMSYVPRNDYAFTDYTFGSGFNNTGMTAVGEGAYVNAQHTLGNSCFGKGTCGGAVAVNPGAAEGMGAGGGMTSVAGETTANGFQAAGILDTGTWLTCTGTASCSHEPTGFQSDYYGTDSGKYAWNNIYTDGYGVNIFKFVGNGDHNIGIGSSTFAGGQVSQPGILISGAADNASGAHLIRLTVASTTGVTDNDCVWVSNVLGTTEANTVGPCVYVNVIDGTHLDLQGSTFTHTYVSSSGRVYDHPASRVNVAVTGASAGTAGVVRLGIANTLNLPLSGTVHVANVGGTTEANGTWTYNLNQSGSFNCVTGSASCSMDLAGTTFVNAWTSGGHANVQQGPSYTTVVGAGSLASQNLTGGVGNLTILGGKAGNVITALTNSTIICPGCGTTTLGTTGGNQDIIILSDINSTDVASATVNNAIGIGQVNKLPTTSNLIGHALGNSSVTTANRINAFGNNTINALSTGAAWLVLGDHNGATCATGTALVIISAVGIPCGSSSDGNMLMMGPNQTVLKMTGGNVPSTSISMIAGGFQVGSLTELALGNGDLGLAKSTAAGTAPGAAGARIELVCGTAGGSAKLIISAGTSATAVTISDNIGSGVSGC